MGGETAFDYVIVGGGAAGCVIAARLAAESGGTVALIERGRPDRSRLIHIPAVFPKLFNSDYVDVVTSEPDGSLGGRITDIQQGRVLGGSSSVGAMVYMRGQKADYDGWVAEHGCTGWGYDDVLPVFRRQERNTRLAGPYHGTEGRMIVADPGAPHPVAQRAIDAAIAAGVPPTDDFNGATQDGAGWYQVTAHAGQRQSSAYCFLKPEMGRENLTVMTSVAVERIRFSLRRAVAVEARDAAGDEVVVTARREIVLAAGSFHSPKLLMLSGVGPAEDLNRHGIDVLQDAPGVGANYQDHMSTPVTRYLDGIEGLYGQDRGRNALRNGLNFLFRRKGLLTSTHLDSGACVDADGDGRPELQYNFAPFAPGGGGQPRLEAHAMMMNTILMRPKSRGRLGLRSKDPADAPRLMAEALSHPDDIATLRRGVRLAQDFYAQAPLRDVVGPEIWPGDAIGSASGTGALDEAIRKQAQSMRHPAGTCRMGPDPDAVVDLALRVNGVDGLRVADCSVMPVLPSGNTRAPTMMIADRAATAILAG
ncbi:Alcohol dehydrogenase [acceptor] [Marinibacterium anthonyi]|nr:Alcohol dehydrogenase [acceptor] [Marinibacterium anthonyi]